MYFLHSIQNYRICGYDSRFGQPLGLLLTSLLWLSVLDAGRVDRFIDSLAGSQHEYKIVLGTASLTVVLVFIAAIRGAKWWFLGFAFSVGTLGFFTYALS